MITTHKKRGGIRGPLAIAHSSETQRTLPDVAALAKKSLAARRPVAGNWSPLERKGKIKMKEFCALVHVS